MNKTDLTAEQQDAANALKVFEDISLYIGDRWKEQAEGSFAKQMALKMTKRMDAIEDEIHEHLDEVLPNQPE